MKRFQPAPTTLSGLLGYIQRFIPGLERELDKLAKKIPEAGPAMEEILAAVQESPEVKDAIYRYIKDREARENA